ncbi:MAG TPA: YHS domain-containing (seleno)protein [Chitinophagaceae bacterium]|nr:YHS domain-containing (seleno)protein [Chitinophagaceae bacterium]
MKRAFIIAAVAVIAIASGYLVFLKEPTFKARNGYLNNINDQGIIIEGYDPVAYFTDNKPLKGDSKFSAEYHGAGYWFASPEHRDLFKNDPEKYAPRYGAFCGYAVSIGKLRPVDPTIYQIENGRLILQHTKEAYELFNKDLKTSIGKADQNWPGIVANHVGKPVKYDEKAKPTASAN